MTENHSNKLIIGTAQFGSNYGVLNKNGQVAVNQVNSILTEASRLGINALDTAAAYGNCEAILGQIGVKNFDIITKLSPINGCKIEGGVWVDNCIDEALRKLKVDHLYGVLMHRSSDLLSSSGFEIYRRLEALKLEGTITKIGISIYDPKELDSLRVRGIHFDIVQAPFNVFDRRLYSSSWLMRLKELGVEVHVRSIFLQGMLLTNDENRPPYFSRWNKHFTLWEKWLSESNMSAIEACVNFVCSFDSIDRIVVGVDELEQFKKLSLLFSDASNIATPIELMSNDENLIDPRCWNLI